MADVAHRAGVSVMTVSYTFNRPQRVSPRVRDLVQRAASELGYHGPDPMARSLSQGKSNSVGVIVGEGLTYAFDDPPSTRFLAGVAEVCVEFEQKMVLIPSAGDPGDVARLREAAVDGYILWTGVRDGPVLEAVLASGKPVAIQGPPPDSLAADTRTDGARVAVVTTDDRGAAAAIAAACFAGAARPAVLSFTLTPDGAPRVVRNLRTSDVVFPGARVRLEGIQQACRTLRIPWRSVDVAVVSRNHRDDARPLVDELLARPEPPDAVVAMSDQLALSVLDAAAATGRRVPDDIRVSGWDDSHVAAENGLTSIHQSLELQGTQCALFALGQESAADPPDWQLVERNSTRRA